MGVFQCCRNQRGCFAGVSSASAVPADGGQARLAYGSGVSQKAYSTAPSARLKVLAAGSGTIALICAVTPKCGPQPPTVCDFPVGYWSKKARLSDSVPWHTRGGGRLWQPRSPHARGGEQKRERPPPGHPSAWNGHPTLEGAQLRLANGKPSPTTRTCSTSLIDISSPLSSRTPLIRDRPETLHVGA